MSLITMQNWPRAIAHIDADAFFASVEQAIDPKLKGKPVITGAERGIVSAMSYEAKALGVKRGMPLHEAAKICPNCVFVQSDYETYSLFSERMFSIIKRFTPEVEEYSIDEAFADLTGLRRLHRTSYREIALKIQETVQKELDITVSVGVSLTKSLAKLCSKFEKPKGITAVSGRRLHEFLPKIDVASIWGFGPSSTALLKKSGINTAYEFVKRPAGFAEDLLGKPGREIWMELNGIVVNTIGTEKKHSYASISKSKTFTPASRDPRYVFAQALRNLESACIKARRHRLVAEELILYLRRSDFQHDAAKAKLNHRSASPLELAEPLKKLFAKAFKFGRQYRATGIVLAGLGSASTDQLPLFEDPLKIIELEKLNAAIDDINSRYGKHTVFAGDGLYLQSRSKERAIPARIGIPMMKG